MLIMAMTSRVNMSIVIALSTLHQISVCSTSEKYPSRMDPLPCENAKFLKRLYEKQCSVHKYQCNKMSYNYQLSMAVDQYDYI